VSKVFEAFCAEYGLAPREIEVLRLAASGCSPKEVADRLHCSYSTVATYWRRIRNRTGLDSRTAVATLFLRATDDL
jgi:DNA-binding CsgD family transcriptional regulator